MFSSFEIVLLVPRSPALRWLQGQLLELSGGYGDCIMLDFLRRHWALRKLWSGCPLFIRFFYDLNLPFYMDILAPTRYNYYRAERLRRLY